MKTIASFTVDHNRLNPGIYISRVDGNITTYDLRFIKPNTPPYLPNPAMHTIEHLFATYARNSKFQDKIIYFGPMGCRTGFYLLVRDMGENQALDLIKETLEKCINHKGAIPGAGAKECGNYLEHDPRGANEALVTFYNIVKDYKTPQLDYNYCK